jgi:ribonuclease P protein component
MLKKAVRLPGREFRAGRYQTITTPYFSIKAKFGVTTPRIGVVANAAVHKSAAKRNFWKRQAKAVLLAFIPKIASRDFLIILFPKVNTLTKKKFKKELLDAAARVTTK